MIRISKLVAVAALAAVLAACSSTSAAPTAEPTVDQATATAMAASALEALNAGDFAAWSRDWSDTMKAAIKEADFRAFRDTVLSNLGPFVSIEAVERSSRQPGTYRYTFTIAFEKGTGTLAFGFADGSSKIEGVFTK